MPEFPGSLTAYGHAVTDARKSIRAPANDPVANRQINRATSWVNWLTAHNLGGPRAVCGVVGEIGVLWFQDVAQWAGVMEALYEYYDSVGLSTLAFCATTVGYGSTLAQYTSKVNLQSLAGISAMGKQWEPLNVATVTADSTEVHAINLSLPTGGFRGVGLANGVNRTPQAQATYAFSNSREETKNSVTVSFSSTGGFYQDDGTGAVWLPYYNYGTPGDYAFLAARGVRVVRLLFRWERVNRTLGGALDTTELARIDAAVAAANAQGIQVILDMHNFGAYYLDNGTTGVMHFVGDGTVTTAHFQNAWNLLSQHYKGMAGILGYQLMNEPQAPTAANVEAMQQLAVQSIRTNGDTALCLISGGGAGDYDSIDAGGAGWGSLHASDFIASSDGNRNVTCSTTSGSTTLTATTGTFSAIDVNRFVTGTNIPANTRIITFTDATHVVLSAPASATGAGITVTVRGNYLFVADHYLDFNSSGTYTNSYPTEIANAATAGHLGFGYPLKSLSNTNAGAFATTSITLVPIVTTGSSPWSPALTFVGPPSGAVEFEYVGQFTFTSTTAGDAATLGLVCTAGGGPSPNSINVGYVQVAGSTPIRSITLKWIVSGLTPGTSYTYKPEIAVTNVRAQLTVNGGAGASEFVVRQAAGNGYPGA